MALAADYYNAPFLALPVVFGCHCQNYIDSHIHLLTRWVVSSSVSSPNDLIMMLVIFLSQGFLTSQCIAGMHIVALAAGYIDAPPAELVIAPRKQVLVAVTSNWQVLCLDHNLKLQWETSILVCSNTFTKR